MKLLSVILVACFAVEMLSRPPVVGAVLKEEKKISLHELIDRLNALVHKSSANKEQSTASDQNESDTGNNAGNPPATDDGTEVASDADTVQSDSDGEAEVGLKQPRADSKKTLVNALDAKFREEKHGKKFDVHEWLTEHHLLPDPSDKSDSQASEAANSGNEDKNSDQSGGDTESNELAGNQIGGSEDTQPTGNRQDAGDDTVNPTEKSGIRDQLSTWLHSLGHNNDEDSSSTDNNNAATVQLNTELDKTEDADDTGDENVNSGATSSEKQPKLVINRDWLVENDLIVIDKGPGNISSVERNSGAEEDSSKQQLVDRIVVWLEQHGIDIFSESGENEDNGNNENTTEESTQVESETDPEQTETGNGAEADGTDGGSEKPRAVNEDEKKFDLHGWLVDHNMIPERDNSGQEAVNKTETSDDSRERVVDAIVNWLGDHGLHLASHSEDHSKTADKETTAASGNAETGEETGTNGETGSETGTVDDTNKENTGDGTDGDTNGGQSNGDKDNEESAELQDIAKALEAKGFNFHQWLVDHNILPGDSSEEVTSAADNGTQTTAQPVTQEQSASDDRVFDKIQNWFADRNIFASSEEKSNATDTGDQSGSSDTVADKIQGFFSTLLHGDSGKTSEQDTNSANADTNSANADTNSGNTEQLPASGTETQSAVNSPSVQVSGSDANPDTDATNSGDTTQQEATEKVLKAFLHDKDVNIQTKGALLDWIRERIHGNQGDTESSASANTGSESETDSSNTESGASAADSNTNTDANEDANTDANADTNTNANADTDASTDASTDGSQNGDNSEPAGAAALAKEADSSVSVSEDTSSASASGWVDPNYEPDVTCEEVSTRDSDYEGGGSSVPNNLPYCGTSTMQSKINNMLSNLNELVNAGRRGSDSSSEPQPSLAEFPWIVAIGDVSLGQECGGSLIDSSWVLTAAHCFNSEVKPCDYIVRIGVHDINDNVMHHVDIRAAKIITHPDFKGEGTYPNDIALVKLSRPAPVMQSNVNTLCLPEEGDDFVQGLECYVASWDERDDTGENTISSIKVPLKELSGCWRYRLKYGLLSLNEHTHLCAGFTRQGDRDSCLADSGGPLFCQVAPGGPYIQAGVVAGGEGCTMRHWPGLYTNVRSYIPWISDVMQRNNGVA